MAMKIEKKAKGITILWELLKRLFEIDRKKADTLPGSE